jgi:murein DD-endopeptidase MepM/ murein hydrolase activator NlpD
MTGELRATLGDPELIATLYAAQRAYQGGDLLRGDGVRALQEALNGRGFKVEVDGVLGAETGAAVGAFQHLAGLEVDGFVGPNTAEALGIEPISGGAGQVSGSGYFHPTSGVGNLGSKGRNDFGAPRNGRTHKGQDIMLAEGSPLFAVTSGTVVWAENDSAGIIVYVDGDDGHRYSYFHLSEREGSDGMSVQANQVIGAVGNTGNSSGAHLHFEVRPDRGQQVDPLPLLTDSITGS